MCACVCVSSERLAGGGCVSVQGVNLSWFTSGGAADLSELFALACV